MFWYTNPNKRDLTETPSYWTFHWNLSNLCWCTVYETQLNCSSRFLVCLQSETLQSRAVVISKQILYHTSPCITATFLWSWWFLCVFKFYVDALCVCESFYPQGSFVFTLCPHFLLWYWSLMARGWLPIDPSAHINMVRWLVVCVLVPVSLYMHLHDEMIDSQDEQVQWNTHVIFPEKPWNTAAMFKQTWQYTREIKALTI